MPIYHSIHGSILLRHRGPLRCITTRVVPSHCRVCKSSSTLAPTSVGAFFDVMSALPPKADVCGATWDVR